VLDDGGTKGSGALDDGGTRGTGGFGCWLLKYLMMRK
jgi:hypothetical protein